MKILLDAMGGDNAPKSTVQGAADAVKEFGDGMTLALLGDEAKIKAAAQELGVDLTPFELIHCTEDVDMHDDPVKAVRHKTDSSLVKGLTMLKNGEADAFVSAGSTGALHVGTSLIVRNVKGVKRPALATCMPGKKQPFLLLDCGANAECRAEMLNAFGTMGSVYMNKVMGRRDPAVALVNNGAEDTKGTPMYREAHGLLKANPAIRFVGNIEPRDIMGGRYRLRRLCGQCGAEADRGGGRYFAGHAERHLYAEHCDQAVLPWRKRRAAQSEAHDGL